MNALRRLVLMGAVVGVASLGGSTAITHAAYIHEPLFQLGEIPKGSLLGETVAFPGPLERMESMTIDSGHLWVAETTSSGSRSRVDEFNTTTGAFVAQPVHVEAPTVYGEGYGTGIAVGHGPGEPLLYVGGKVNVRKNGEAPVVSLLSETGALIKNWTGASTPDGSFGGNVTGVAVDNSTDPLDTGKGDVYVAVQSKSVIYVFHPETQGEEHYVGQITGLAAPFQIAVDEADGDLVAKDGAEGQRAVDVFKPTGLGTYELALKITGPPPNGVFHEIFALAVDSGNGDIYVTEFPPGLPYRVEQFSPTGTYLGQIEKVASDPYAMAVDPTSHDLYANSQVYGPGIVIPDVTTDSPTNPRPESVTLNGTVNPDDEGPVTCQFEWGTSPSFGHTAPCSGGVANGTSPVPVQVPLSGLERGVNYYYRLQATNKNGTNPGEAWQTESFTTTGAILREESVSNVSAESVTFEATIDPAKQPTSYYFQYGTSTEYTQRTPTTPEAIGSGILDVEVPDRHVQGLSAGTEYHYRVVVVSEAKPGESETVYGDDHTFTTQAASGSFSLLDGRQWEMVSPPDKLGALIEDQFDNYFRAFQASAAGDAIAYPASSPTEGEPQGYSGTVTVFSVRGETGWSSRDISPGRSGAGGVEESVGSEFRLFSPDLSQAIVVPINNAFTPLSPQATESTPYLRTNYVGGNIEARCSSSCYQPLVTAANTPQGTVFGDEPTGVCRASVCGPQFAGASRDLSHIIVTSPVQLTPTPAAPGGEAVYEWSADHLQLVSELPNSEGYPVLAGSSGRPTPSEVPENPAGPRHAVSDDGGRVVLEGGYTDSGEKAAKGLYLRDVDAGETIQLDAVQGGTGPSAGVDYMTASSDASRVFFLDKGHLTAASSASGEDLYEYDLDAPSGGRLTDLTADSNAGEAAGVEQVIGASEDGTYVYFVASGALVSGARPGGHNLYVSHEGTTRLVAALADEDRSIYRWPGGNKTEQIFARVSPNGEWLALISREDLTEYDTRDAVNGRPD